MYRRILANLVFTEDFKKVENEEGDEEEGDEVEGDEEEGDEELPITEDDAFFSAISELPSSSSPFH